MRTAIDADGNHPVGAAARRAVSAAPAASRAAATVTAEAVADTVLPPDAEAIMDRALREEGPPAVKGMRRVTTDELRFQRRMTLLLTLAPLAGVVAAILLLWGQGLSALDLGLFLTLYLFTGVGVTVGYHRLFTHRSFEVPKCIRITLAVAGSMSVQGAVIDWVATHRRHHAYADEYGDPHSPHLVQDTGLGGVLRGLWHAHAGWLFNPDGTVSSRWAPDLRDEPAMIAIDRAFPWLVLVSFLLAPVVGLAVTGTLWGAVTAFVWGSLVRIFLLHHVTWSINSICHFFGERPFASRDESTNNWPLSLLSFGESWHNNHHAFPTSARHGLLRGQFDPSWRVIRTLQQLRLARNVRLPSPRSIQRKWAGVPRRLWR
ncbi:MAG TPA: fatty acid desaturase [Nitriliruptorales bacterium]|nr:fatty acid desaturase [Nitriliruptorales bacterium]